MKISTDFVYDEAALERFLWWIYERHNIYLRRKYGDPWPWTEDRTLQRFFFTHPYRELDKTTIWFKDNIREPRRDRSSVIFATACFRYFNYIPTGELLLTNDLIDDWDPQRALNLFDPMFDRREKIFTGAYIINSAVFGCIKHRYVIERITEIWRDREVLRDLFERCVSLQQAHALLQRYNGFGPFMSYEVITDLRHTYLLEEAIDLDTWAHLGPGATRGIKRVVPNIGKRDYLPFMEFLLRTVRVRLPDMPHFEMREIEHSLCEFDKYERGRCGAGNLRRLYRAPT